MTQGDSTASSSPSSSVGDDSCPYGAANCPKQREIQDTIRILSRKVDLIIAVILIFHGAELVTMLGAIS